jgi:signal peptidase I
LRSWAVTLAIFLFVVTSVGQGYVIPTGSMDNTLLIGDHLVVDKLGYPGPYNLLSRVLPSRTIARGDIVVFEYPLDPSQSYVKRVAGVPGDRIRIAAKQLFVNGYAIEEPYKVHSSSALVPYRDDFPDAPPLGLGPRAHEMLRHARVGEMVVPKGNYFVMGDNRDDSDDSRFWGFVPAESIRGTPRLIYWSFDAPTPHLLAWFDLDHARNIVTHFYERTRWDRTVKPVRSYPLRTPGE